ncbi:MAG: T9SS type A sorting domain-containing protein [Bacteroidales bacterium]|nr:T9SS type A sorting domain-containing protein [Bacteroidales bacterium]
MKTRLLKLSVLIILLCTFGISTSNAQTTFGSQEIITTTATGANSVYACDIDGDGDFDVLSSSQEDDKIAWYENTDGNGTFGEQQIISDIAVGAFSVYASDIDGDGDIDVLSAASDKITWYENTDGNGNFGSFHIITDQLNYARTVYACDIDGDGDNDVLSASFNDSKIAWYENTDGNGTFGEQQIIAYAPHATSVYACDIDGDGDNDVLSSSHANNIIAWYENTDGAGNFGEEQVITTIAGHAIAVYACDIDGDGDNDVLSACWDDAKIAWYENLDDGAFGEEQIIITDPVGGKLSVYACDLDNDGDNDVLSADYHYDRIAWYENTDGNGTFGPEQIITTSADYPESVFACDIDGDGDNDVLSASYADNKIAWYENLTITGIETLKQNNISIYPNPAKKELCISSKNGTFINDVNFYNKIGQRVLHKNPMSNKIDVSMLQQGIYIIEVISNEIIIREKLIIK